MTRLLPALLFALLPAMETVAMERHESTDTVALGDSVPKKRGLVKRFLDYFNDANKPKEYKKFDFSIIGGPHYSTDTKFGLGLVAAGLYRTERNDTLLHRRM